MRKRSKAFVGGNGGGSGGGGAAKKGESAPASSGGPPSSGSVIPFVIAWVGVAVLVFMLVVSLKPGGGGGGGASPAAEAAAAASSAADGPEASRPSVRVAEQGGDASALTVDSWVFDDILGGTVGEPAFFDEFWQQRPLYTNGSAGGPGRVGKIKRLLSLQALEALTNSPAFFQAIKDTKKRYQAVCAPPAAVLGIP